MTVDFRLVKLALFNQLVGGAVINFTAQAVANNASLLAPSTTDGLFPGLPVFGVGVGAGTTIAGMAPDQSLITLTEPMTVDTVAGDTAFTTGFQTTGRRIRPWSKVAAQPALFLRRTGVHDEEDGDGLIRTALDFEAWVYSNAGEDPDIDPDDVLAPLEQCIRNALDPTLHPIDEDGGMFTLGTAMAALGVGPVYWCRITGKSDVSTGDLGPQALSRIPIRVTLP